MRNLRPILATAAFASLFAGVLQRSNASAQTNPARAAIPTPVPSAVLPVVPTVAPGYRAPQVAPTAAQIIGVTQQPFVGITLQDAVGMALLKNPNLAVSASNVKVARYQVVEAKGPFDVQFRVEPSSSFSVQPPENIFFAGPGTTTVVPGGTFPYINNPGNIIQHQSGFQYGVGGQTISGTTYSAGIQQTRTFNNTVFNAYNPYYLASLNLSVTQPLLRNLGMNQSRRQLKLALVNEDANAAQSFIDASNTISQVEDAYWNLVAAWRNVAIQEEALKESIAQQQSNVRLAKRGAAAPIDAVESSTQVSNFQDQVFSALQIVSELQNQLKGLIVTDPADPVWMANLVPTSPVQQLPTASDLNTVIAVAQQNRPEVRQAIDKRREAEIDRAYAKNQSLPQADLQATYMSNGFAGIAQPLPPRFASLACEPNSSLVEVCPTLPGETIGTMPQAYHNLWAGAFPTFDINLTVSFPLQNDLGKGLQGAAAEEERQADVLAQGVAERIGFEARNALQSYQAALSRLDATRHGRESAEQVLASELRKFRNGASTTFLVLQRQVQLQQARGTELQAQTDLNKSVVELERVEGTILTTNGVGLQTLGTQALATPAP
ncbi:MAG: TolC family protein [Candidatus Eremiobacteraeota bacterium]|nr:TolC family protein [Candidatus Eremiobacteraeota bacterium]MBV8374714.1 TolC family protein [Candidatus Eremiobacteraeota bacterium]